MVESRKAWTTNLGDQEKGKRTTKQKKQIVVRRVKVFKSKTGTRREIERGERRLKVQKCTQSRMRKREDEVKGAHSP